VYFYKNRIRLELFYTILSVSDRMIPDNNVPL